MITQFFAQLTPQSMKRKEKSKNLKNYHTHKHTNTHALTHAHTHTHELALAYSQWARWEQQKLEQLDRTRSHSHLPEITTPVDANNVLAHNWDNGSTIRTSIWNKTRQRERRRHLSRSWDPPSLFHTVASPNGFFLRCHVDRILCHVVVRWAESANSTAGKTTTWRGRLVRWICVTI